MAKTSPSKATARPKSKPIKATAGSPVASRAKREAQGDAPPPVLKAPRTKSAERRSEPPAAPKVAAVPKAHISAPPSKVKRSTLRRREAERRQPAEIQTAPVPPEPIQSAAPFQPPKPTRDAAPPPARPTQAANEGAQNSAPDVETLAHNIAQAIEQGGKVLAAYLQPRASGEIKATLADEIGEMVRSIGRVAEYYMADPQRAFVAQTALTKQFVDLWAQTLQRLQGEQAPPVVAPELKRQALR